ncbi:MAG: type II toxin-antitoxin system VapB family antitoxin [Anaerolineales bacterium]|jgi:antitoxin VapB
MEIAKLFQNGKSQAVRLPKKFRFRGDKVLIKKMGEVVILLPYDNPWQPLAESLKLFSNDFMEKRDQPETQTRENPFA